ncbi:nuclear transport factor 2 family protein [Kribbella sp. NPDC055110]
MEMQHPNALLMRKVDEALLAGDFPEFLALHTEDVVMHVPGRNPVAGDHVGREGVAAAFQHELSLLDAPPEIVVLDDLGSDDHAAGVMIQRMRRGGRSYEGLQFVVARVRDGQLSEVWFRPEDQEAFDNFFA